MIGIIHEVNTQQCADFESPQRNRFLIKYGEKYQLSIHFANSSNKKEIEKAQGLWYFSYRENVVINYLLVTNVIETSLYQKKEHLNYTHLWPELSGL